MNQNNNKDKKMTPLQTKKGSKIWYSSKYGVGKEIGGKIYAHVNYISEIVPKDVLDKARKIFLENIRVKCNTFCWDKNEPHIVRFDDSFSFDISREPSPGRTWYVNTETGEIKSSYIHQIFHHKWLWVKPNYTDFNVTESYEWSQLWLSKLNEPASGYPDKWKEQLKEVGLV